MTNTFKNTVDILQQLVSFDSISGRPTHDIISYISNYLKDQGIESTLSYDEAGDRANIFASIGPHVDGGVVLSGHTDVVPVEGQRWNTDPFSLTQIDNRFYGRGSVDMKGFLACVLASVPVFKSAKLSKPIHIAFSYDEETGGYGMPVLLKSLAQESFRPRMVIVGEPTQMKLITGHKAGYEMRTEIIGQEAHSSNPSIGVSAISVAVKLIAKIEEIGARFAANPHPDSPFDPPYCTINVGTIEGGTATNATAGWCNFKWEFRPMPNEDGSLVITELEQYAQSELLPAMRAINPDARIDIINEVAVPALNDANSEDAQALISQITGLNSRDVVSFGTDAGYFSDDGFSTVVFGPGSIDRAHKADEFITEEEIKTGLDFLSKLAMHLSKG